MDVLVNNAGIMPVTPFDEESEESMRRQVDINLHGVIDRNPARDAADEAAPQRPHRQRRLLGGQGRRARDRHLLRHQARRGRPHRGGAPGAARHRRRGLRASCRSLVNTALTEGLTEKRGVKAGRARGRRRRNRRRARTAPLRRLRAEIAAGDDRHGRSYPAPPARGDRPLHGHRQGDDRRRPRLPPRLRGARGEGEEQGRRGRLRERASRRSARSPEPPWGGSTTRRGGGASPPSTTAR